MSTGVGTDVAVGFAIETTPNTRIAPDTFVEITQESLRANQSFIMSKGLGGGRRMDRRKILGQKEVGGSVAMEMRTAGLADLLRLSVGGDPTPSGVGPYTRSFVGGGDLPTSTWQVLRPYSPTLTAPFDYTGCMVNQWTLTQNPNEFAQFQAELFGYDELTDQVAATFAPPADLGLLSFQNLTSTTPDGAVCFDSVTLTGNNSLERNYKVCAADGGLATVRPNGLRTVSGTLAGDFNDMTAYNRYLAGTEGTLTLAYSLSASASLTVAMNVLYTGETPQVSGPGVVKQGIPFVVLSETSDAAALTVTLVNDEV